MGTLILRALVAYGTLLTVAAASLANSDKPIVLTGLDPVLLVQGRHVNGSKKYSRSYGKFTYLFASAKDELAFSREPARYAVQNGGACLHMREMPGDPRLFLVFERKIYLAGAMGCLDAVSRAPLRFIRPSAPKTTVAIFLFPGADIIDYSGPWEVFGHAGYKVITVAAKAGPVATSMGQTVVPQYSFGNCPKADVLIVPGGGLPDLLPGTDNTEQVLKWIRNKSGAATYTMSVCNGAYWLARAGLLNGKSATTTYDSLEDFAHTYPKVHVVSDRRFVDNGSIITTGGLFAGVDGAFHVVERLQGVVKARQIALMTEYRWEPGQNYARGNLADKYVHRAGEIDYPSDVKARRVSSDGDMVHWEEHWELTTANSTLKDLTDAIERTLSPRRWQMSSSARDRGVKDVFSFIGDDGRHWSATYTIQPDFTNLHRFVVAVVYMQVATSEQG